MSAHWWEAQFVVFDLETTGVKAKHDRAVSWCVGGSAPGYLPQVMSEIINPGVEIPAEAVQVHGISTEHAQEVGNPPRQSLWRLVDILAGAVKAKLPIVGMNLSYDFTMLRAECLRHGLPTVEQVAGQPLAPVIDVYVLDKQVDRYRKGSRKLADDPKLGTTGLATHYGVLLTDAHDAIADALAAGEVARRIGQRYPEVGSMGVYRLHACQAEWKAEQAVSFQAYKRRTEPGAVIDPCWPFCADDTHP